MKENNTDNTIVYDEAKVKEAQDLLNEIKNDLSDADNTLYDAVMKISRARGIENVEVDDTAIDMRMPERLMIQCREDTKNISDTLDNQVHAIEAFFGREEVKADNNLSNNVQLRKDSISGATAEQGESRNFYYDKNGNKVYLDDNGKVIGGTTTPQTTVVTQPATEPVTSVVTQPVTTPVTQAPVTITNTTAPRTLPTSPYQVTTPVTEPPFSNTTVPSTGENGGIAVGGQQLLYGPPTTPSTGTSGTGAIGGQQLLYGPPTGSPTSVTTPSKVQALYAAPNNTTTPQTLPETQPISTLPNQVLYSAPSTIVTNPPTTVTVPPTIIDSKKGDDLGTIVVNNTTVPASVPTNPITATDVTNTTTAIQERVGDQTATGLTQHASPISASNDDTTVNYSSNDSTIEYSSIPETGVGMKDKYGDYLTPAAIGAAAGIAGMIAAKAMHNKKDKEENEE